MNPDVVFWGFGMQYLDAPVHIISLKSNLVMGAVAARPSFPIEGVDLILGNDLAGLGL